MTSTEIAKVIAEADAAWSPPLMNPGMPTEVAQYRATLEVAYQLALMNEGNALAACIVTDDRRLLVRVD